MKLLLLGNGGREHALAWKLTQSPLCSKLFVAPGNSGTGETAINVPIKPTDFPAIKVFVIAEAIDMIVVGPEEPLVNGIWDFFRQDHDLQHVYVVGPSRTGAMLEGSKAFAKVFMKEFGIPTASYRSFNTQNIEEGIAYIATHTTPIVLKADGPAAGKGVLICSTVEEAQSEFRAMLGGKFGAAGARVVVEQFLSGIEFSVFVLTDGRDYVLLPEAKDYKRIGEGDTGLNTGGMGAVSPVPFADEALMEKVKHHIIEPTVRGISARGMDYHGFIFFGLINVGGDPYVIEYNCRLGDPETEVVLPRLESDLVALFKAMQEGRLGQEAVRIDPQVAVTVMLVSGGYPEHYEKGKEITGVEAADGTTVFHAGMIRREDMYYTDGGRVMAITARAAGIREAMEQAQHQAEIIRFEGKYYRKDIGRDLL